MTYNSTLGCMKGQALLPTYSPARLLNQRGEYQCSDMNMILHQLLHLFALKNMGHFAKTEA